ncbi:MAG: ABC transporter permease [Opitutales bacterium]|nr:ABC transporter permease [Opitutales bacterium]MCH8541328.1 ABC transporter permease [Opitutales bacterium]
MSLPAGQKDRTTFRQRLFWSLLMAFRDTRAHPWGFLLAGLPVVLGIAALVAVESFRDNMEEAIERESRQLLGADLVLSARRTPDAEVAAFLEKVPGEGAREVQFSSMLNIPESGESRLVQVRAIEGGFPFYGQMETVPAEAFAELPDNPEGVLLEESLLVQFALKTGDSLRIGDQELVVAGNLRRTPGEAGALGMIAPRVYLSMEKVEASGLLTTGSVARHRWTFRFPADVDPDAWVDAHREQIDRLQLRSETVAERREALEETFQLLGNFLHLVGFAALLLGAVGVGSAVRVQTEAKRDQMALLRCLGTRYTDARRTILWQILVSGAGGALLGGGTGVALQYLLPLVLGDFLPVAIEVSLAPWAILGGVSFGFLFTLLFALPPLLGLREVSPLETLRSGFSADQQSRWAHRWPLGLAVLLVFFFAWWQTGEILPALAYTGGLLLAVTILALVGKLFLLTLRKAVPYGAPWAWRQATANLFRPRNQTTLVLTAIGLGTALLVLLFLVRENALGQIQEETGGEQANIAFFDIQPNQLERLRELAEREGFELMETAPIVTMRIRSLAGRPVEEWLQREDFPRWSLQREFRSTFRAELADKDQVVAGEWIGEVSPDEEVIPVSLEKGLADDWGVGLGDRAVFDVQGVPFEVEITSLREVDWREMRPNFFFIFPSGVLEEAPRFYLTVTRAETTEDSARLQRAVTREFPTISILDLSLVLDTIREILNRVTFVIQFMAFFTVATGMVLLFSVIGTERHQRMRETHLLRVLGASRTTIRKVLLGEYILLGALSGATGVGIGIVAAYAVSRWVLDLPWTASPIVPVSAFFLVLLLTLIAGVTTGTKNMNKPSLPILRNDGK